MQTLQCRVMPEGFDSCGHIGQQRAAMILSLVGLDTVSGFEGSPGQIVSMGGVKCMGLSQTGVRAHWPTWACRKVPLVASNTEWVAYSTVG